MSIPPGSDGKSSLETPPPGDTQVIDLHDPDVSAAIDSANAKEAGRARRRSTPPPLPSGSGGLANEAGSPPGRAPRSTAFYATILLVCLAVGVGGGLIVAMSSRKAPPHSKAAPSASAAPGVITIPVVEVDDDPDSGP